MALPGSQITPLDYMPRSPTPVVTASLALSRLGLLLSTRLTVSAFTSLFRRLSFVHDYTNFGAQSRGLLSRLPWLRTSVTGFARKVCYQPVG
jgi:hypothetical protein